VEMRRLLKAGRIVFVLAALSPAMIKMRILAYITMSHNLAYITMSHNLAIQQSLKSCLNNNVS